MRIDNGTNHTSSRSTQATFYGRKACFTANYGIFYTRGTTIHLEATYRANELFSTAPASIRYRVIYNGNTYDSPDLSFGKGNGFEADPYGLCELLDDGRVGGYFQPLINASFPTATDCFIGFMR